MTISELAPLLQSGTLSPVELTRTMLARIDALDGRLRCFATVSAELALQQALADPALTLPFAGIGQERIGLFGCYGEQAQII